MATKAGQILDKNGVNFLSIHSCYELIQAMAAEGHTAYVIIEGFPNYQIAVLFGKCPANLLLVQERIHFLVIVVGQSCIDPGPHHVSLRLHLDFYLVLHENICQPIKVIIKRG